MKIRGDIKAGQRFGRLTIVTPYAFARDAGKYFAIARCDCGNETTPNQAQLRNGVTQCQKHWANQLGMSNSGLRKRLNLGWSLEKIFTTPPLSQYQRRAK